MLKITSEERGRRLLNQNHSCEMGSTDKAVSHFQFVSHTHYDHTVIIVVNLNVYIKRCLFKLSKGHAQQQG